MGRLCIGSKLEKESLSQGNARFNPINLPFVVKNYPFMAYSVGLSDNPCFLLPYFGGNPEKNPPVVSKSPSSFRVASATSSPERSG